ncbi:hypothetical protein EV356DRAFT_297518 [Viridothelium virens]|uniref:Zn(2)-C6 fungal-type domain-containing protein n=1 Tax=Viridothelium virens TaxID=1048519 RepID=A0A6A6H017_VIRVR|nr:hypothetical protein EV356DRAFT_297518 [Viridothelium virens]
MAATSGTLGGALGATRRRGARKRTGSFGCRKRHTKCDEQRPVCQNCSRSGLVCQFPALIVPSSWCQSPLFSAATPQSIVSVREQSTNGTPASFEPQTRIALDSQNSSEVVNRHFESGAEFREDDTTSISVSNETSLGDLKISVETIDLLQAYQNGIGIWLDLFDCNATYQRELTRLVPKSRLLLHSVCALAAQQLSIVKTSPYWTTVAEAHYGQSLSLLRNALGQSKAQVDVTLATSVLLASYELLACPGKDYVRHFQGTRSLIESFSAHKAQSGLLLASFWIYARHDVGAALCNESPTLMDPDIWPVLDLSQDFAEKSEDLLGNEMLRLLAKVLCLVHGDHDPNRQQSFPRRWNFINSEIDHWYDNRTIDFTAMTCCISEPETSFRYWFPSDAAAIAMQTYHVAKMLLLLHRPHEHPPKLHLDHDLFKVTQENTHAVIDIALSGLSDAALVHATQALLPAAKQVLSQAKIKQAIELLQDTELRTGFHTQSKVRTLQTHINRTA